MQQTFSSHKKCHRDKKILAENLERTPHSVLSVVIFIFMNTYEPMATKKCNKQQRHQSIFKVLSSITIIETFKFKFLLINSYLKHVYTFSW